MKLYKMELYKICHKKIFIVGAVCVIAIALIRFGVGVADEEATVDGVRYTGYRAVQVNREITEEFKGAITDEKVERIAEKYGFPSKVEHGWNYFRDANFLNQFVMDYLSDGYMNDEYNYHVATKVYPIADTELQEVIDYTGKEIILEYYQGWNTFLEVLSFGMTTGSILILCCLAGVFANEGQTKMTALLFTTKEGKEKDVHAKVMAAFTVTLGVWLTIFLLDILLCGSVYGFDGLHCYNGQVVWFLAPADMCLIPMGRYLMIAVWLSFFGMVSLCFMTMCISAGQRSVFHAVVISAICYGAPVLAAMFINMYGIARMLYAAPVFMGIYRIIEDIYDVWLMLIGISVAVSVLCIVMSYRKYRGQ
ncbi:MAG: hypothetical protein NC231_06320 [Bacillus sp. (in: Bacteria)]|nr:hypothetical protein [Bacillus sp. (in: firmicutes)]MCM1426600.1 ABC transporter permease [Eubacterium sp.]